MKTLLLLSVLILLTACSAKPHVVEITETINHTGKNKISIVSHGWHTGFVIPAQDIENKLPHLKQRFGNKPFLEFGWGDKGFYQAQEITAGLAIQAILWPTDSIVHVVSLPESPQEYFPASEVLDICLPDQGYQALLQFITNSFYHDESGNIVADVKGIYGDSQFYQGEGDYYLMNTCNKWTAKGLQSAGMDISPMFKLTATSVMNFIKSRIEMTQGEFGLGYPYGQQCHTSNQEHSL